MKTVIESNISKIELNRYLEIKNIIELKEEFERRQEEQRQSPIPPTTTDATIISSSHEHKSQDEDEEEGEEEEEFYRKMEHHRDQIASVKSENSTNEIYILSSIMDTTTGVIKKYYIRKINNFRYYVCYYCSSQFRKPSDLIRHTRIHTSEKPYKCNLCHRVFTVKSTLITHMKTHAHVQKKAFKCKLCWRELSCRVTFKSHLRQQHKINDIIRFNRVFMCCCCRSFLCL